MAGPIAGTIEHYYNVSTHNSASYQASFVDLYRFFDTGLAATKCGTKIVSYHTGAKGTGMPDTRAMGYYDSATPAGVDAWFVVQFQSASVPYELLFQWGWGAAIAVPGTPAVIYAQTNASNGSPYLGIAGGITGAGTASFNGTRLLNGRDTKGATVWVSSSVQSVIYFPRSNDGIRAGAHGTARQNLKFDWPNINTNYIRKMHAVCDYDNFVLLVDSEATALTNIYNRWFAVLKYTPLSGIVTTVPYIFLADHGATNLPAFSTYGDTAGTANPEGAVLMPLSAANGTCFGAVDGIGTSLFQAVSAQPNKAYASAKFNEFPLLIGAGEGANQTAPIGTHSEFARVVYNMQIHDTLATGSRAVFGAAAGLANIKMTIPWHTGTTPGSGFTRSGVQWSLP